MTRPTSVTVVTSNGTRQRWRVESIGPRFITLTRGAVLVRTFSAESGRMTNGIETMIAPRSMAQLRPYVARERCGVAP